MKYLKSAYMGLFIALVLVSAGILPAVNASPELVHLYDELDVFRGCSYYDLTGFDSLKQFDEMTLYMDKVNTVSGAPSTGRWEYEYTRKVLETDERWDCTLVPDIWPNMTPRLVDSCKLIKTPVVREYTEWLDFVKFIMGPGSDHTSIPVQRVRYCAAITPVIGKAGASYSIDVIPKFDGVTYSHLNWWNATWIFRRTINISNPNATDILYANWTINISIDTTDTIRFMANCSDLRIVCNDTYEIARNVTGCRTSSTQVWFSLQSNISAGSSNTDCSVYYGNQYATSPSATLTDYRNVFGGIYWQMMQNVTAIYPMEWYNTSVINDTIVPMDDGRESKQTGYKAKTGGLWGESVHFTAPGAAARDNDYDIPAAAKMNLSKSKDFAISMWVMLNASNWAGQQLLLDGRYAASEYGIYLEQLSTGKLLLGINGPGVGYVACDTSAAVTPLLNFTWTHVLALGNQSACSIYVNGNNASYGSGTAQGTFADPGYSIHVGDRYDSASDGDFQGWIDNLVFMNRTLSALDIDMLYYYPAHPPATLSAEEAGAGYATLTSPANTTYPTSTTAIPITWSVIGNKTCSTASYSFNGGANVTIGCANSTLDVSDIGEALNLFEFFVTFTDGTTDDTHVYFTLYYAAYNLTIRNEMDGTLYNVTNGTLSVFCDAYTWNYTISGSSGYNDIFVPCEFSQIVLTVDEYGDLLYRILIPEVYTGNLTFYVYNESKYTGNGQRWYLYDLTGDYYNGVIRMTKVIPGGVGVKTMSESVPDAEGKVVFYMAVGEPYCFSITSADGDQVKLLNCMYADLDESKPISLADIPFIAENQDFPFRDVSVSCAWDKTIGYIRAVYNDTAGKTTHVNFTVYNASAVSQDVKSQAYALSVVTFTYNAVDTDFDYFVVVTAQNTEYGEIKSTCAVTFGGRYEVQGLAGAGLGYWMPIAATFISVGISLSFTRKNAAMATASLILMISMFMVLGWYNDAPQFGWGALVLCMFIIVLMNLKRSGEG